MKTMKQIKLKNWYLETYPTDDLGGGINPAATFYDLFYTLNNYQDVYKLICISDSLIRERLFEKLAEIMNMPYDYVYDQWLKK